MASRGTKRVHKTSRRKAAKGRRKSTVPRLPRRQLALPAGYRADGSVATLRDVLAPAIPTIDGADLTDDDRAELTLMRIHAQPDLRLVGPGYVIDKNRAIEEVRRGTPLGSILVNVEHRAIDFLRQTAEKQRRRRKQRQRAKADAAKGAKRSKQR